MCWNLAQIVQKILIFGRFLQHCLSNNYFWSFLDLDGVAFTLELIFDQQILLRMVEQWVTKGMTFSQYGSKWLNEAGSTVLEVFFDYGRWPNVYDEVATMSCTKWKIDAPFIIKTWTVNACQNAWVPLVNFSSLLLVIQHLVSFEVNLPGCTTVLRGYFFTVKKTCA